ncbi:Ferrichrome-iron receptor [Nitrospira sp. KM1]|uniref:TonB-dependent siderophore receptor n=1 Tax=Nitrospira sp. KM1 TaxID=1936990 RepID=UPI0013A74E39|nr:TonB-dependent receptor [Nitrospira sp. KM1]BCA56587.1 Ferrichrome-iron receptor [Nitrospira sp. KM1]
MVGRAVGVLRSKLGMCAVLCVGIVLFATAHSRQAVAAEVNSRNTVQQFDIPSQPLSGALKDFALAAGLQLSFNDDLAAGRVSPDVRGSYTNEQALQLLLAGSGLTYRFSGGDTVIVERDSSSGIVPGMVGAGAAGAAAGAAAGMTATVQKPVKVPEIMVKDVKERDNDTKSYVAEEANTATRTDTPIKDVPQSIQVITRKVIEEQRTFRLQNTLENISGINATESGASLYDSLIIRGFTATDRSYFRNGLIDPFAQFTASDTYNIRRIEVLKGPASVLYGQGDPGGVINLVTNRPLPNAAYMANVTLGNFNFYRSELDATGPLNASKTVMYRLNVAGQKAHSFIDYANRDLAAIAPAVTWLMGSRTTLTVEADYLRRWSNDPYGLPAQGSYLPNINGPIPRERSVTLGPFSTFNRTSYRVGYDLTHQFNNDWSIRNAYRHTIAEDDRNNLYASGTTLDPDERTLQRFQVLQPAVNRRHAHSMITNLVGHLRFLEMDHTLLTGFELRQEKVDQFQFQFDAAPPLDLFAPNYGLPPLPFTNPPSSLTGDTQTAGFYAQDQITILPQLKLLAGLRFDYVHQSTNNSPGGTQPDQKADNNAVSPRVGVVYSPIEPWSLYASWTRGFQPNSPSNFNPNGDLFKPERSTQYEIGTKYFFLDNRVSATLAWYHLTRENLLTPSPDPAQAVQGFSVQTGEQRSQGIELDVTAQLTSGWNVIASYAYTDAEVTKDNTPALVNQRLSNVPYNKMTLWSTYYFQEGALKGFGAGGGIFAYTGRNATIFDPTLPEIPGYVRADGALYYNHELQPGNWLGAKMLNIAVNMRNLLDQRYVATSYNGSNQFFFGEPRTVLATVGLRF